MSGRFTLGHAWRARLPRTGPGPYAVVDGRVHTDGLEVVVTHHCNLRCRGCAYLAPVRPPVIADPHRLRRDLAALARAYHACEARVLGGEPLLHPQITTLLAVVRDSGVCDSLRVITNGARLERMPAEFWGAVDAVSVSVYPGREPAPEAIEATRRAADRHGVVLNFKHFRYFRESYSEIGTADARLVGRIYRTCQMAHVWRCHTLWNGRLYRCPQSLFLSAALHTAGRGPAEGIQVGDDPSFPRRLLEFLESPEPLPACTHCLGSVGRLFPNRQIPRALWRDPQRVPTEQLVDWPHMEHLDANPHALVRDTSYLTDPDPSTAQ